MRTYLARSRPDVVAFLLLGLALALVARAADSPPTAFDKSSRMAKTGDFVFSILPKSFQRNPTLDMTFNTEFTPYGRLLRKATPENPVYYVEQDAGFRSLGWAVGGEKPPKSEDMERVLTKALATNSFLPAAPEHAPGLAIIYFWGSHNKPDDDTARLFPELLQKNVLERAMLVGGKKLVSGMSFAMEWGESPADREEKMEFLRDQANAEIYYVVASAYDYQALAHGQRKLAWRTTLTVTSAGLAMNETLLPLVTSAAPFFGRETTLPEIGSRRVSRTGYVEIGKAIVVPDAPTPAAPSAPKPAAPPSAPPGAPAKK